MIVLETKNLDVAYGSAPALHGINIVARAGQITGIVGPNGAGKTTFMLAIMGIQVRSQGEILLKGLDISREPTYQRALRGLWLVPDNRGVFPAFTVRENFTLAKRKVKDFELDAVFELFPFLRDRLGQRAAMLSGGEQQMLGLARAFLSGREVILVDEPSLGLAPVVMDRVIDALRAISDEGRVVVVAEQNADIALDIADYGYVLSHGRQTAEGRGNDLRSEASLLTNYFGFENRDPATE